MNDLIWIDNTLYPRWFVIAVPVAVLILIIVAAVIISYFADKK